MNRQTWPGRSHWSYQRDMQIILLCMRRQSLCLVLIIHYEAWIVECLSMLAHFLLLSLLIENQKVLCAREYDRNNQLELKYMLHLFLASLEYLPPKSFCSLAFGWFFLQYTFPHSQLTSPTVIILIIWVVQFILINFHV